MFYGTLSGFIFSQAMQPYAMLNATSNYFLVSQYILSKVSLIKAALIERQAHIYF